MACRVRAIKRRKTPSAKLYLGRQPELTGISKAMITILGRTPSSPAKMIGARLGPLVGPE
jgi:hypothetical protein